VHEAVAAEAAITCRPATPGAAPMIPSVRRHLVEAAQPAEGRRRRGEARDGPRGSIQRRGQAPVHVGAERARLLLSPDAQEQPRPFAPHGDPLVRIDDERGRLGNPIEGNGAVMNFDRRRGRRNVPLRQTDRRRRTTRPSRSPRRGPRTLLRAWPRPTRGRPCARSHASWLVRISTPSSRARAAIAV